MKILYHKNCYDGFGAAWALSRATVCMEVLERDCIPVEYGSLPPKDLPAGEEIYILDFSYSREVIQAMRTIYGKVFVVDHHKTAKEELKGLDNCIFDMKKSGAVLTWEEFSHGAEMPLLLAYIQDRDLWKFELPNSKAVNAYLRSQPFSFERFDELADVPPFMAEHGAAILQHVEKVVAEMADRCDGLSVLDGYLVPKVNATAYYSEVGDELCKRYPNASFSAVYFARADNVTQWSLRSHGDFDVSVVAKRYGGGGHKNAAGFEAKKRFD